ncbi:malonyl-CoA decarboxylase, mitochondrial-like [Actinia tenebrosa]|uniref:Malonyl-CoA decarboxylase, mitochondrial-like n=1 Tax=Actinia tenebrosa TaxID=6105 RepID=A0A6P8H178_ACTTE|nr:malonyl-CoA decarboxylase, mitochondrial-like [Actinia tenebrosa]
MKRLLSCLKLLRFPGNPSIYKEKRFKRFSSNCFNCLGPFPCYPSPRYKIQAQSQSFQTDCTHYQYQSQLVESNWLDLLMRMADKSDDIDIPGASKDQVAQIRTMLSRAVRVKRSQEGGDLMPNAIAKEVRHFYNELSTRIEKMAFFLIMERDLGVNHQEIREVAENLIKVKDLGVPTVLRAEDRLRQVLEPHYIQLLSHISRLEGGVKFIVDMRNDLSEILSDQSNVFSRQELQALSMSIKNVLAQWFAVGLLDLERINWNSSCSVLEKIIKYEAVHTIQGWEDLKRRLAPDRRVYIYTHRSMPREPIVVLHTALEYEIPDNIQVILSEPEVDIDDCEYELENRTTAVFYSISSTQKGLSGVDLGNFLIKHVVRELQHEFPNITQYATLSPIPGFRHWLLFHVNESIENEANEESSSSSILLDDERVKLLDHGNGHLSPSSIFKDLIQTEDWHRDETIVECVKGPLMRLCARYLYEEKRRGFALDPVANFHIRNGAWMWRLNWSADTSPRGLENSFGLMMNYKYVLEDVDRNNQQYLFNGHIAAPQHFLDLLRT